MNKYEKLIEYIIAEQDDLARQLFHEIVVEKSRQIYESLGEDEDMMDGMHGGVDRTSQVDGLMDEIEADEITAEAEGDEPEMGMDMDMGDEEGDMDMDMGDEEGDMDMGDEEDMGDEDLEDRVVDLEAALDELKAEFDALMADQDGDGDHDMEDHEAEDEGDEAEDEMAKEGLREYVEKVSAPANAEGHEVGAGKSAAVQKKSPGLQNSNNMGGKRFDLGKGSETAPDGQRPHSTAKAPQEIDVAKRNVNKVGGNKGAQDFYGTKAKAKSGEEGGVNKSSIESGGK